MPPTGRNATAGIFGLGTELVGKLGKLGTEPEPVLTNQTGADWTFVCPKDYKNIKQEERRIEQFYKDGFRLIPPLLGHLGVGSELAIPQRYRRHIGKI